MIRRGILLFLSLVLLIGCGRETDITRRYQAERALWKTQREAQRISIQPRLVEKDDWLRVASEFEAIADKNAGVLPGDPNTSAGRVSAEVRAISARALMSAAQVYTGLGDSTRTMALYERIRTDFADVPEAVSVVAMAQGRIAEGQQNWSAAAASYRSVIETIPPNPGDPGLPGLVMDLPLRVARLQAKSAGSPPTAPTYAEARTYYETIIKDHPGSRLEPSARIRLAELVTDLGAWDEAIRELARAEEEILALDTPPQDPADVRFGIAMILGRTASSTDSSRATFESLIRDYPDSPAAPRALMALNTLALQAGDTDQAVEYLDRLRENYPQYEQLASKALLAKARILEQNDQWTEALKIYRSLPVEHPVSEAALQASLDIANHYSRVNDTSALSNELKRAEASYREFLSRYPPGAASISARQKLIQVLSLQERYQDAVQELIQLGETVSPDPQGAQYFIRAAQLTYAQLADTARAAEILEHTGTLFSNAEIGRWAASESERLRSELEQ